MSFEYPKKTEINEDNFYPGKSSSEGFLAPGEKLNDVIERDQAVCERLGTTPRKVGEAIEAILKGEGKDKFDVVIKSWRGMQPCPFDKGLAPFSSVDFTITNKHTGKSFGGPGLIAHLLKEHSFFEGDTSYRVDPEKAIEVLFERTLE